MPRIRTLLRALKLSPEEFSARYRIPQHLVLDWAVGRSHPDALATAYLHVIAKLPAAVRAALAPPAPVSGPPGA